MASRHELTEQKLNTHIDTAFKAAEEASGAKTFRQKLREFFKKLKLFFKDREEWQRQREYERMPVHYVPEQEKQTEEAIDFSKKVIYLERGTDTICKASKIPGENAYSLHIYDNPLSIKYQEQTVTEEQLKSMFRDGPSRETTDIEFMSNLTARMNIQESVGKIMQELSSLDNPLIESISIGKNMLAYYDSLEQTIKVDIEGRRYDLRSDADEIEKEIGSLVREKGPEATLPVSDINLDAAYQMLQRQLEEGGELSLNNGQYTVNMHADGEIEIADKQGNVLPPDLADDIVTEAAVAGEIYKAEQEEMTQTEEPSMPQRTNDKALDERDDDDMQRSL